MTDLIERDKWKYSYDDQYQREIDALELDASQVLIADLKRQLAEAQASLEAARKALEKVSEFGSESWWQADDVAKAALAKLSSSSSCSTGSGMYRDYSAVLEERDRAVARRCISAIERERGHEAIYAAVYSNVIRREFGLEG